MQVLIPYALSDDPAAKPVLHELQLPTLQTLLQRLSPEPALTLPENSPISAHERLQAQAQGLDPQAPAWAALRAHALGLPGAGASAWAFVTPSHWEIGQARVSLGDPKALDLREDESRALLAAMQPFFAEDGITLHFDTPLRWLAQGEPLRGLLGAAPERVVGRNVAPWLPDSPLLRRLQNEMQMLLYTHAVTDARAERGAMAVNSFWLSGGGALSTVPAKVQPLLVHEHLVAAAVQGDWARWARDWQALDAELVPMQAALEAGQSVTLTLCSELVARRYTPAPRSAWARLLQRFRPQPLSDILGPT
ncbi:MAG: phosphoglycerate mutase [Hylemonella sp.]|nr:phosphoglycerate mutase [Hylemonella sp.]